MSIEDAQAKIEAWRVDYNQHGPHGALGRLTPNEFARQGQDHYAFEPRFSRVGCLVSGPTSLAPLFLLAAVAFRDQTPHQRKSLLSNCPLDGGAYRTARVNRPGDEHMVSIVRYSIVLLIVLVLASAAETSTVVIVRSGAVVFIGADGAGTNTRTMTRDSTSECKLYVGEGVVLSFTGIAKVGQLIDVQAIAKTGSPERDDSAGRNRPIYRRTWPGPQTTNRLTQNTRRCVLQ
jgi:hypothetical protein